MLFGYTHEQLANITAMLNTIEIKGRQNCLLIDSIFKVLENGVSVNLDKEEDEAIGTD